MFQRKSSTKVGKGAAEEQLNALTAELQRVQREQQELTQAQVQAVKKLEELRKGLEQAQKETKQAELVELMEQHLVLDAIVEQRTEELLEVLRQTVVSQGQLKRLASELNLSKDFSKSFEFLTAYVGGKMRTVFGQGLQLVRDGQQPNVSELDRVFFGDARRELAKNGPRKPH
ncbi:MAG: hypothetical protein ACE5JU_21315 [Candidatus Binatia bacterium]